MTNYVVGFLFDPKRRDVLLIEKQRPEWQKGRWNGIGGHIEEGETPEQAMHREGLEEAGLGREFHKPHPVEWEWFAQLTTENATVYFFRAFSEAMYSYEQLTDEKVGTWSLTLLRMSKDILVNNTMWLIEMALSMDNDSAKSFTIIERY